MQVDRDMQMGVGSSLSWHWWAVGEEMLAMQVRRVLGMQVGRRYIQVGDGS